MVVALAGALDAAGSDAGRELPPASSAVSLESAASARTGTDGGSERGNSASVAAAPRGDDVLGLDVGGSTKSQECGLEFVRQGVCPLSLESSFHFQNCMKSVDVH